MFGSVHRRGMKSTIALGALWLALTGVLPVDAQGSGLRGRVTDMLTGQPLVAARISVGNAQTSTDAQGRYMLSVSPGTCEVHAHAAGYIGMSETRQTVSAGAFTTVDFTMVLSQPNDEQQATLDALFFPPTDETQQMPQSPDQGSLFTAGVSQLPATIRVLMTDGIVVVMPLDEYIKGVLPSEVPPSWPAETLKAQAVASRCYAATAHRHTSQGADVCTTTHCQVWSTRHYDTTDQAVDATHNVVATYAGSIISAYFFAHCDGHTRNSEDVWGGVVPYCRSVACPCGNTSMYGHGVGLCQEGARALAGSGSDYRQILMHYYTGIRVSSPPAAVLSDGRFSPAQGDTATSFTFEVNYTGSDAPIATNLYVDGYSYSMDAVSTTADGATLYRYAMRLQAGEHTYGFHFEDGYNPSINLPSTGSLTGPSVTVRSATLPTPTPLPTPTGIHTDQWSQTTQRDFADGTLEHALLTREDNGEVSLQPGSTRGTFTSAVHLTPVDFLAVGARWQATLPASTALTISLRTSFDGQTWSDWNDTPPMDAQREEARLSYGELLWLRGPYVQYRVTFTSRQPGAVSVLRALTLVFIDSKQGPTATQAQSQAIAVTSVPSAPTIIPRSGWGCDEKLFNWPPEYRTIRKIVVHHTSTPDGGTDPAAMVRAIYYYHAVTRGWGDIGYNYLIDKDGRIYEGRSGGEGVVGGHAKQYAWGSIGVSLIGDYEQVDVPAAMQNALVELLAWKCNLHFVQPTQSGFFIDKNLPNIMGHRDGYSTDCPGKYAYARLPEIRQQVLTRMAALPPNVRLDAPSADASVSGIVDAQATGSPAVTQVNVFVDDVQRATLSTSPFAWKWNTTGLSDGSHHLKVQARTAAGLQAESVVALTVDNTPPTGSLSGTTLTRYPNIALHTMANGAVQILVGDSWHWEGEDLQHQCGQVVNDADALNGKAWQGRATDAAGWWYGPYYKDLPIGYSYRVYYRLKTASNSTSAALGTLDVTDDFGRNTYTQQTLTGQDFWRAMSYQEPYLDFAYSRHDQDGLELRVHFEGHGELYMDRVTLFRAPRAYASSVDWTLLGPDGQKEVQVRYLDAAGNVSPVYTLSVLLDTTSPVWQGWNGSSAWVQDVTSGLYIASAEYCVSSDGGTTWSAWQSATLTAPEGTLDKVAVSVTVDPRYNVRLRISDRAGNSAESPVYGAATPIPSTTPGTSPTPGPTGGQTPTPTVSPTIGITPTSTPTASPSSSATATASPTNTPTATASATATPTVTASPTATPAPTDTVPAPTGTLSGRVLLQGCYTYSGVSISVGNTLAATTGADGSFTLSGVPVGTVSVYAHMGGYLNAERTGVLMSAGQATTLPDLTLRGGDANGDCGVNLSDLVIVSSNFGLSPPRDGRSDVNHDGYVDLQDLLLVTINLSRQCPTAW